MKQVAHLALAFTLLGAPVSVLANGVGENVAWQFESTAEKANRAYIEDLRRKQQSGFYSSPQYTTFIDHQNNFNCSNSASAAGNGGSNSAVANTPSATGPNGTATGNQNSSATAGEQNAETVALNSLQDNWGPVISDVLGDSYADASNNYSQQVLNTKQNNSGIQDASVNGSNGCSFEQVAGLGQ